MTKDDFKRVLIISYYWPPSGGIGVHRCLKFAKYLRGSGWEPVIYAPENAHYPYLDQATVQDIPEGMVVLKGKILEPFRIFKFITGKKQGDPLTNPLHVRNKKTSLAEKVSVWIRGNLFIPDARFLWIRPSVRRLSKYLEEHPVDAIFSDGPPHTNTVIACRLAQKFKIPWLADFQDPWTQVDYYKLFRLTRIADKKHHKLEQEAFRTAKKITIASDTWKKDLEKIGAKNVDVLYYGYDEDDFKGIRQQLYKEFVISHAGLLGYDRNPEIFLKTLAEIIKENENFAGAIKLIFAGVMDYSVRNLLLDLNLGNHTEFWGTINKSSAIELSCNSHLLLMPLNKADNNMGRIPGKLYEYLRTGRPILALGPPEGDVGRILSQTGHGTCLEYEDAAGIRKFLEQLFVKYSGDGIPNFSGSISTYSVREQTMRLGKYLDLMTE